MVNFTRSRLALLLATLSMTTGLSVPAFGAADGSYVSRSYSQQTLGSTTGAELAGGNPAATQTMETNANVTMIGKSLNALNARVEPPSSIDIGGTTYTTVYSFGKALLNDAWFIKSGGYNNVELGLAPTEVRIPFVLYAIGPLMLDVAPGVRFQADLSATITPTIAIPLSGSALGVQLSAQALAAGFVEAYASIVIVRGGVGGQVDLIDGHLDVNGNISFNGNKPVVFVNGIVQFFNGRFYAFLDIFGFLTVGWKRLIDKDIYTWNGFCASMGYLQCPAK
ncbi:MAG: hypothetical protein ACXVB9_17000 [Bdellovibrionota bacterium]